MLRTRCTLLLALWIGTDLCAEAQTTWYVDVTAVPPGSGTLASPYASIQFAHNAATTVDSDTLLVAPGTYVENVTLSKRITVRATGGAEVTVLRPAVAGPILRLQAPFDEPESLVVEGFAITGLFGPANSAAVRSTDGKLVRCIVHGNRGTSFFGVETAYDTFLVDCTIADNDIGVEVSSFTEALWMRNCIVWGNTFNYFQGAMPFFLDINYSAGGPFPLSEGPGNVNSDPGMWNVAAGDYRLRPGSPCIDTGNPALPNDPDASIGDIGYYAFDANYAPLSTYCVGKLNSGGCTAQIAGSGLPSATSAGTFQVTATLALPGTFGVLAYGFAQGALPFQGGTLCIAGAIRRTPIQAASGSGACGGVLAFEFNSFIQSAIDPSLTPGTLVYAQWWYRDAFDPAGFSSSLSNALCFGIAP